MLELPALAHLLDLGEPPRAHDRDHPLLRLGDHHLPRLHPLLAQRHAIQVDIDAVVGRHLGERRCEARRAAVLQRLDQAALDKLERHLDQLLARERVADLNRGPLLGRALPQFLTRKHRGAADPVAPRGRAVHHDQRARSGRLRGREPLRRKQPDAHRVDEAVAAVALVEDRLAADVRHTDTVAVVADSSNGSRKVGIR